MVVPAAKRDIKKLRKTRIKDARLLATVIDGLGKDPRPFNAEKLTDGDKLYRIRSGNLRVIYQIRDNELVVVVAKVGDRKDVYKNVLKEVALRISAHDIRNGPKP